jgi:hypothetical protein
MFKTFPEFTKLTLADREEYESYIKDFPPISDLAFPSLMTMWSVLDNAQVSVLNGNLIISYWMPGDDRRSGLSLLGANRVDESICAIFDYLRDSGRPARLVNVPQFVIDSIRYPEIFHFDLKYGDEDCIVAFKRFAILSNLPNYKRTRIKKFVKNSGNLGIKSLDLRSYYNRKLLLDCAEQWPKKNLNNIGQFEEDALRLCVPHATELSIKNVCLFEDGGLIAYNLYYIYPQSKYLLISHSRLDYAIPHIFDYMAYSFSQHFLSEGVEFGNIHSDMGILRLRALKIALKPVDILRKYTIEPVRVGANQGHDFFREP